MRLVCSLILLWSLDLVLYAQEPGFDHLVQMVDRVACAKSYHAKARIEFKDPAGKVVVTEMSEAYSEGSKYYSKIGERVSIFSPTQFLYIDHQDKKIIYQSRSVPIHQGDRDQLSHQLKALLSTRSNGVKVQCEDPGTVTLRINDPEPGYEAMEIHIFKMDHRLLKIIYFLDGETSQLGQGKTMDRIELTYTTLELDVKISNEIFNTQKVLDPSSGTLRRQYHGYELIQQPRS
jgi:hypothetical protein